VAEPKRAQQALDEATALVEKIVANIGIEMSPETVQQMIDKKAAESLAASQEVVA
jgi:hypothetical protein